MEEHSLLIAEQVNKIFGPVVAPLKHAFCSAVYGWFGKTYVPAEKIIPDHIVFAVIIFLFCCIFFPLVRRSFSMEKPGKVQHILEVVVEFLNSQLEEIIGHGGKKYLPMIATIGLFIFLMNIVGLVPGFLPPTSNVNVTAGCALVVFFYYNYLGIRKQGLLGYLKHFCGPVAWMAPLMIPIEIISHLARPTQAPISSPIARTVSPSARYCASDMSNRPQLSSRAATPTASSATPNVARPRPECSFGGFGGRGRS